MYEPRHASDSNQRWCFQATQTQVPMHRNQHPELLGSSKARERGLLVQQRRSPARRALATRGRAASHAAAARRTSQKPSAKPLHPWQHCKALTVSVPHDIVSWFRQKEPISILQDFLNASARESESNLECSVADLQEGPKLVGVVPAEGAIRAEAAAVAMIDLGTGGPEKDRKFGQRVKGGMRQLASLERQPQENRSPFWVLGFGVPVPPQPSWSRLPAGRSRAPASLL